MKKAMRKNIQKKKSGLMTAAVLCVIATVLFAAFWKKQIVPIVPPNIAQVGSNDGSVTLELVPATATIEKGAEKTFTLKATVDDGKKLTGIQVEITYNKAKIGTPVITQGDFLSNVISAAKTENGKITFVYGASLTSGGVTGSGTVATIKVTPPDAGTSSLTFTENTEAYVVGRIDNALKSAGNASLTVEEPAASGSPAASPSPSPSPSVSPSPKASDLPASRTTTLRTATVTCSSLAFSWDKIKDAKGYIIDLADNQDFTAKNSSGTLGSDKENYAFTNLKNGTRYYVRITQTDIHDFPRYTQLGPISTLASCPGSQPSVTPRASVKSSPKASVRPSVRPSPSSGVTQASDEPRSSLVPTSYTDNRFDDANIEIPEDSDDLRKKTLFARFIAWLVSLFE